MAVVTITWARFLDGAITVDLEHDDTDDTIISYTVTNSHPSATLRVTFYRSSGTVWRTFDIGPGQVVSDSRPFPQGVKTILDIPQQMWEVIL